MSTVSSKAVPAWIACGIFAGLLALVLIGHLVRVKPRPPVPQPPVGLPVNLALAAQAGAVLVPPPKIEAPPQAAPVATGLESKSEVKTEVKPEVKVVAAVPVGNDGSAAALLTVLADAHAEIYQTPLQIVSPATVAAQILKPDGSPLPDVAVMPFAPNGLQPCTTPQAGLRGTLVVVTSAKLASASAFTDCIAVVDAASPPRELGLNWDNYANLGFRAVLVTHHEGLPQADWTGLYANQVTSAPLPFPRGVATPSIMKYDGAEVVLHLSQRMLARSQTGIVARLPAAEPSDEVVVLLANLDEVRAVADLAAGPEQRLNAAWQRAAISMLGGDPHSRRRDVLVVAANGAADAQDGLVQLVGALGPIGQAGNSERLLRERDLAADANELRLLTSASEQLAHGWLTVAGQDKPLADDQLSALLARELAYVLGESAADLLERASEAAIAATRMPLDATLRSALISAKRMSARLGLLVTFEPTALVKRKAELLGEFNVAERLRVRLLQRQQEVITRTARHTAELTLANLMRGYRRVIALSLAGPGDGQLGWIVSGQPNERRAMTDELIAAMADADPSTAAGDQGNATWSQYYEGQAAASLGGCPLPTGPCAAVGWPSATLVSWSSGKRMGQSTWPAAEQASTAPTSIHAQPALRLVQRLAAGARTLVEPYAPHLFTFSGTVVASGIGGSAVPTHPLVGALVGDKARASLVGPMAPGARQTPLVMTDLSGRYGRRAVPPSVRGTYSTGWSPTAVTMNADGVIHRHSDESKTVQNIAHSLDLGTNDLQEGIDLVCFRAVPIALLDRVDPRTMRTFAGVEFARSSGLSAPDQLALYEGQPGPQCWFLQPAERLAVLLKTGSEDNPLAKQLTSFILGADQKGFLAADGPYIIEAQRQSAASMAGINSTRLVSAVKAGLADQRTEGFNKNGNELLTRAGDQQLSLRERILAARDSGTYGQIVYSELRGSIAAAISSIVWYLFLLVPFAFFLERLVFGFADIRRALTAHALIFLTTFGALGLLHPAFRLVGSPVMILLGFVILLISLAVSGLFLARAKENLAVFNRRRGGIASAQPDMLGIISTSIALGINGLSRRKVRTGLTCATLTLITLCLILFVSARSGLVQTSKPNGPASYQGFIVRGSDGRTVPGEELLALRLRYGQDHAVVERQTSIGVVDWWRNVPANPVISVANASGQNVTAHGLLLWSANDPLLRNLHFAGGSLTAKGIAPTVRPLAIPAELAQQLGVQASALPVPVTIGGNACAITGIFESASLAGLRDLDGRYLRPFDLLAMPKLRHGQGNVALGLDGDPLIEARSVIISDDRPFDLAIPNLEMRTTTCAVILDNIPFREAKELIERRLEQTGQPVSYGLDGIATTGRTARSSALDGLAEMLIPLLIAGLTVLNTMRGSVYERRDEIGVYNAVGIAPRFISAMFFAEALVFAVVGAVLGYLLSLMLGRTLDALGWQAGLQVDYASLTPIFASLALAAVVFLSTWFPARAAAEIAAPSDDAGWRVPEPDGDSLSFPLPFAFGARDRIAVLAFFNRVFADHGDGGGGSFHCDAVSLAVTPDANGPLASIRCSVWLKPFDLGVAQNLELVLRPDLETSEWLAHLTLTRRSGTREAWLRRNRPFIAALRQRFLHWRAVDAATRDELHAEAVGLLRNAHV